MEDPHHSPIIVEYIEWSSDQDGDRTIYLIHDQETLESIQSLCKEGRKAEGVALLKAQGVVITPAFILSMDGF